MRNDGDADLLQGTEEYYDAYDKVKEESLLKRLRQINPSALASVASGLRNSIPSTIPLLEPRIDLGAVWTQRDGQNCNLDVQFEDGVTWIARVRLIDASLPPTSTQTYIAKSELATLQFLHHVPIPTPRAYYAALDDNPVRAPYILMEKLPGKPLVWEGTSAMKRTRIMEQLADIFLTLEKYPFSANRIALLSKKQKCH